MTKVIGAPAAGMPTGSSSTPTAAASTPRRRPRPPTAPWGSCSRWGRVGCALDNAAPEAFNSTLKVEFAHRHHFTTRAEARIKISTWIADFYNTRRRNSANDGLAPIPFERRMVEARRTSTAQLRAAVA